MMRQSTGQDHRQTMAVIGIIAAALILRFMAFGHPRPHEDEHFYLYVGQAMAGGAWPYADIWDRKPAGLFLIYALPGLLPYRAAIWAYQLLALGAAIGTALIIRALARRIGWAAGALPAALLYLAGLNLLAGYGGQSPVFYNLPVAGAAWWVLRALTAPDSARAFRHAMLAMLLIGIALTIKPTVLAEGLCFGLAALYALWRHQPSGARLARCAAALVLVAVTPTMAIIATFVLAGHGDDYLFATVLSFFLRRDNGVSALANLAKMLLPLAPLLIVALAAAWRPPPGQAGSGIAARFAQAWLLAAIIALAAQRPWYEHYGLPLLPPLALATAPLLGFAGRWRGAFTLLLVAAYLSLGLRTAWLQLPGRGTMKELAAATRLMAGPPGSAYVYGGPVQLYWLSGRCPATRWLFTSHLRRTYESGAIGTGQLAEIRRIMASRPAVLVMDSETKLELPGARAEVIRHLGNYHAPRTQRFGKRTLAIFHRRPSVAAALPTCWHGQRPDRPGPP